MKAISISETANLVLSRTDREKTKPKRNCIYGIHNNLSTPIFIFISMSVYFFLRNKIFKNNLLLRLVLFILPLSSLGVQNFRLYQSIKNSDYKPLSGFYSILYRILEFFLIVFSIIAISLIIPFSFSKSDSCDIEDLSSFLLPFLLLIIYLLSTACSLAPGSFSFIDSGFDSLLDLLLLVCSLVYLMIILRGEEVSFYPTIFSFIFVLLRSLKARYKPSPRSLKTTVWRQILFFIIFVITIIAYLFMLLSLFFGISEQHALIPFPFNLDS
ncbi:DUF2463 domain-containing protein [Encephalitozoon intestinalis]|nr:DUF2463 domain-containing protein [Encephalitozoon intestinalis]